MDKLESSYHRDLELIISVSEGLVTGENVKKTVKAAMKLVEETGCCCILFDIRLCTVKRSYTEAFMDMKNLGEKMGMTPDCYYAILFDPELFPADRAKFIETVATENYLNNLRMFICQKEAIDWLQRMKNLVKKS